jgi:DNA-directed RNA polymerase specialized sigma24 family protein
VMRAIHGLPEFERRILLDRSAGHTYAEIADRTGSTIDQVSDTLYRARRRVRQVMREWDAEE